MSCITKNIQRLWDNQKKGYESGKILGNKYLSEGKLGWSMIKQDIFGKNKKKKKKGDDKG